MTIAKRAPKNNKNHGNKQENKEKEENTATPRGSGSGGVLLFFMQYGKIVEFIDTKTINEF